MWIISGISNYFGQAAAPTVRQIADVYNQANAIVGIPPEGQYRSIEDTTHFRGQVDQLIQPLTHDTVKSLLLYYIEASALENVSVLRQYNVVDSYYDWKKTPAEESTLSKGTQIYQDYINIFNALRTRYLSDIESREPTAAAAAVRDTYTPKTREFSTNLGTFTLPAQGINSADLDRIQRFASDLQASVSKPASGALPFHLDRSGNIINAAGQCFLEAGAMVGRVRCDGYVLKQIDGAWHYQDLSNDSWIKIKQA